VSLGVYNLAGQLIRTLVQGRMEPGHHAVEWNGRDDAGNRVGSGIYLYRLVVEEGRYAESRRMLLLK
jgi:flagellar hook assembly protein FlgD